MENIPATVALVPSQVNMPPVDVAGNSVVSTVQPSHSLQQEIATEEMLAPNQKIIDMDCFFAGENSEKQ